MTIHTATPQRGTTAAGTGLARLPDAAFARLLATSTGDRLLAVRAATSGDEPRTLRDRGDAAAQELLAGLLAAGRPGDAVLSEEAADDHSRLASRRVWIIDPLDGTREFSEPGRDDWAVHVALWADGDLVAGAVALPARGMTLATDTPPSVPQRPDGPLRIAVSRTRPPALVGELCAVLGAVTAPMGSAGVKVTAVVTGEVDAYVHAGGQYEWDSAAPVAVARAAGLQASRIDGAPLRYNARDPHLPDLLVCRPEHANEMLSAIRVVTGAA